MNNLKIEKWIGSYVEVATLQILGQQISLVSYSSKNRF